MMITAKQNIAVLMGGVSNEHEVSLKSGAMVAGALDRNAYNVSSVTITKDGGWLLPPKGVLPYENEMSGSGTERHAPGEALDRLKANGTDVVFIALHGANGEDGTMQGALELVGLAYTGSGVAASALAMDKWRTAELLAYHGLKIPKQYSVHRSDWESSQDISTQTLLEHFSLPAVVKPSRSGSSVGVSIVRKTDQMSAALNEAFRHDDEAIIQQFIAGDEVTVPVLENEEGKPVALPPIRIVPKDATFFDYRAKYMPGASEETTELGFPEAIVDEIKAAGVMAHTALGCVGMSRTDLIVASDGVYVLETNTIPGMTETSLLPQSAKAAGIPFPDLLDRIIQSALRRKKTVR